MSNAHGLGILGLLALALIAAGPGLWGPSDPAAWIGSWQKAVFTSVCHQDLNRSIWLNGAPMAVCDRCFGIYLGLAAGLTLALAVRPPLRMLKWAALAAILAILIDVTATMAGVWMPFRPARVLTGLLLGCVGGFLLVSSRTTSSSTSP